MSVWAIVATGQSLKREDVEYLRGKCNVAVVSNAYELAPWADMLVSHDRAWWNHHQEAKKFAGQKFSQPEISGITRYNPPHLPSGCNSGLMAMLIARDKGAKKIILLGFDMHGTHYFGAHPEGLKNTPAHRFRQHIVQFNRFNGCEVINCTEGSALKRFPIKPLREVI